jgi:nitronate monooxygenase
MPLPKATEVTYKTVWVAGPTIENTTAIRPVTAIVDVLTA